MCVERVTGHFDRDKTIILVRIDSIGQVSSAMLLGLCRIIEYVRLLRVGSIT